MLLKSDEKLLFKLNYIMYKKDWLRFRHYDFLSMGAGSIPLKEAYSTPSLLLDGYFILFLI